MKVIRHLSALNNANLHSIQYLKVLSECPVDVDDNCMLKFPGLPVLSLPYRHSIRTFISRPTKMVEALPKLEPITRLSPLTIRILGGNPGKFQLQGTNTYLVGRGAKRILIDTGEGKPAWLASVKEALESESATIDTVILTHWHHDHVSGVKDLLAFLAPAKPTVYKCQQVKPDASQTDFPDGHVFRTEGASLRAVFSPGHAGDHMALVLDEEDSMFTGDNVLGHGTAVFEDLPAYLRSLALMETQFSGRAYPGHGAVIEDGRAKIREYVAHRKQRESEIVEVLRRRNEANDGLQSWGSMEAVRVIYKNYPESLHAPAEGGVKQVLRKLEGEGRVAVDGDGRWRLVEKAAL